MRLLDSRRLTGPNLLWEQPGAVIGVEFGDQPGNLVVGAWEREVRRLLDEVDWRQEATCVRRFDGGASLAISAPVDALYAATEINEAAWDAVRDFLSGGNRHLLQRVARQLRYEVREEERPRLQRLLAAARDRSIPTVLDTEQVSLGLGCHSRCFELCDLPHPDDVPWAELGPIPLALVTGTNGKTTTVRLMASIGAAAGRVTGVSSTDWLAVGEDIVERDDYAGPEGARRVLRDRRCELAVLETARGGLLRRGLAVERADAALITNIAADHIGEFGVKNLDELADVKWVVTRALGADGRLVLNADDPLLRARAHSAPCPVTWFSPDPSNPLLRRHAAEGGLTCTLNRGRIVVRRGRQQQSIVAVDKVPICFGGAARHNICNALGAVALAQALGIEGSAIRDGLLGLPEDANPGRANLYRVNGATVLLDFAHNPHGLEAVLEMAAALPAQRRLLVIGQAGDRSDEDIRELAKATAGVVFDRVLIKRMDAHSRGRDEGATAQLLRTQFRAMGYRPRQLLEHSSELGALRASLRWAGPGDQVVFLAHEDRDATMRYLAERQAAASA